ncbi:alpha/beta hydrolase fold domain-containing protein [Telmatospirillum sp.]|uniref:alpha/beta hydrolase fold domain-containing protein n=1 Tax=Telmatospirillum sp. TaxID=2079197 RepID=UPI0028523115|nr:alpha/beta hydrolase fold domain-containing protein [Telmatospirillum sp.]MDR3435325.1 alpha/beta hydrolase fold domain-containing protein [Telmatospirillum sp.]
MRKSVGKKADDVYAQLKRQCIMSDLAPGQQLVELELAASMQCSQSTVREALLRLQEDGLVSRQGYRGTSVTLISPIEAQVFLDLRSRLEVEAVRQSISKLRLEDFKALRSIIKAMEEAAARDDNYALFEQDLEFHMCLFRVANLPALVPILVRCSVYNHRNKIAQSRPLRALMETARRHHEIVGALETGDAAEVENVMRRHVLSCFGADDTLPTENGGLPSQMSPSMEAVFTRIQAEDRHLPEITRLAPAEAKQQFIRCNERWNRIDARRFEIEHFDIPNNPLGRTSAPALPAMRIVSKDRPPSSVGTILHVHGGGWTFGCNQTHLGAMARLAELTGCAVIGLDYSLAPEGPFPAGLNDCGWGWRWLRARASDSGPWFFAGDSSGANLALAMLLDLRNLGEIMPNAALLFYGVYSPEDSTESHQLFGQGEFGLTTEKMAWYWKQYLSGAHRNPLDPRVSPLLADLSGLPPLLVTAAGLDPLRDDSVRLAQRLLKANSPFEFKVYEGVLHGFMQMSGILPEAMTAFQDAAAFVRDIIATSDTKYRLRQSVEDIEGALSAPGQRRPWFDDLNRPRI